MPKPETVQEFMDTAEKLRAAVYSFDVDLTELIGTDEYPNSLTSQHMELRNAALSYDDVVKKIQKELG